MENEAMKPEEPTEETRPKLSLIPGLDPDDPFNPANVRLADGDVLGAEKVLLTIPARRPQAAEFFRCHPTLGIDTALLNHEREMFYLAPAVRGAVPEALPYSLLFCISRAGAVFLWPLRLPGPDGRSNHWWDSARAAATYAKTRWVRIWANQAANTYDVVLATHRIPEPSWPDLPLRDILHLGFKDRLVDRLDHPILKVLRGEA